MPVFTYKAIDVNGTEIAGEIAASSRNDVEKILNNKGVLIQAIKKKRESFSFLSKSNKVKGNEILLFCHEFVALLKSGISITDTIATTANNHENHFFKHILLAVLDDIKSGEQPSNSFNKYPEIFDSLFISAIKTGEKTGNVVHALQRYTQFLKQKLTFAKKVKQALAYPLFLLLTLVAVMALLFTFVMPRFISMYEGFGAELPYATRIVLGLVEDIHIVTLVVGALFFSLYFIYKYIKRSKSGLDYIDRIKIRMPLIGSITLDYTIIQLTSTLSTLLQSGLNLVEALKMTSVTISNKYFANKLDVITNQVIEGKSFSEALAEQKIVPANTQKMIEAGEGSGQLANLLYDIMVYYEENLDYKLSRLTTLIEPVIMLFIGLLVGGIIVVMYLPIFSMADIVK